MFIFNGQEVAFDSVVYVDGAAYSVSNKNDRVAAGITEVADPVWPTPSYAFNVSKNIDGSLSIEKKPDDEIAKIEAEQRRQERERLFAAADILFMKEQRGEVEPGTWLAECKRIREAYPK